MSQGCEIDSISWCDISNSSSSVQLCKNILYSFDPSIIRWIWGGCGPSRSEGSTSHRMSCSAKMAVGFMAIRPGRDIVPNAGERGHARLKPSKRIMGKTSDRIWTCLINCRPDVSSSNEKLKKMPILLNEIIKKTCRNDRIDLDLIMFIQLTPKYIFGVVINHKLEMCMSCWSLSKIKILSLWFMNEHKKMLWKKVICNFLNAESGIDAHFTVKTFLLGAHHEYIFVLWAWSGFLMDIPRLTCLKQKRRKMLDAPTLLCDSSGAVLHHHSKVVKHLNFRILDVQ